MKNFILFFCLITLPIFAVPEIVGEESCIVENTCTILVPIENGYELYLKNKDPNLAAIKSVTINISLKNMSSDQVFPKFFVLRGGDPVFVTNLKIEDVTKSFFYSYSITVNMGDWDAKHDDAYSYSLPFPSGIRARIG
ncbi:peptidase, partial [Leptospira levettii]